MLRRRTCVRRRYVGNATRRFTQLTSWLLSISGFLYLLLPLTCLNVIFVRKQLAISSVWRIEPYYAENAMWQYTANSYVSAHRRFLLTGVRVGLEATEPVDPSSSVKSDSRGKVSDTVSTSVCKTVSSIPQPSECNELLPTQVGGIEEFQPTKVSYGGGSTNWPLDDFFGFNEFSQNLNFMDNANGPSKAESSKLGDSDSSVLRSSEEEMDYDDHLGCVPDSSWTVPQIPSPPTASGLYWPKDPRYSAANNAMFVPDICSPHIQQPLHAQRNSTIPKRRRNKIRQCLLLLSKLIRKGQQGKNLQQCECQSRTKNCLHLLHKLLCGERE